MLAGLCDARPARKSGQHEDGCNGERFDLRVLLGAAAGAWFRDRW